MGEAGLPLALIHAPDFDHDHAGKGRDLRPLIDEKAQAVGQGEFLDLAGEALGKGKGIG